MYGSRTIKASDKRVNSYEGSRYQRTDPSTVEGGSFWGRVEPGGEHQYPRANISIIPLLAKMRMIRKNWSPLKLKANLSSTRYSMAYKLAIEAVRSKNNDCFSS